MGRARVWVPLLIATVVLVGVGIWYFLRDEYPFQISEADIVQVDYETFGSFGSAAGVIPTPPNLAAWIGGMELDTSGERTVTNAVMVVVLRDGRSLRLDLGATSAYGTWITGGREGDRVGVAIPKPFRSYLSGLAAGLRASSRTLTPPSLPSP